MGFEEDELDMVLIQRITQVLQSTDFLHISIPCTSVTYKVITSGETSANLGQIPSDLNLKILTVTVGNAAGDAPFRRVPGFTELLNDPATVARSSQRRSDSVPSLYPVRNYVSLFGNLFRQIIPLSIWHTPTHDTILSLQAPTFYTTGAFGLYPHEASNHIALTEKDVLGASFNAQPQTSDIPGVTLHDVSSRYAASVQAQSLASDILLVSLRAYMEELSTSFNTQDQAPDDP
jgi:hypothetical protein